MAELVYAFDLKSNGKPYGFKSHLGHHHTLAGAFFGLVLANQVPSRAPPLELKGAISAFFRACIVRNRVIIIM